MTTTNDTLAVKVARNDVKSSLIGLEIEAQRFLDKVTQESTIATFVKDNDLVTFNYFTEEEFKSLLKALEDYRKTFKTYQKVLGRDE